MKHKARTFGDALKKAGPPKHKRIDYVRSVLNEAERIALIDDVDKAIKAHDTAARDALIAKCALVSNGAALAKILTENL